MIEDFPIRGCARYGGGFEGSGCLDERTEIYRRGRDIDVETFFWNDATKEWGAKVVVFGANRSIPVRLLFPLD